MLTLAPSAIDAGAGGRSFARGPMKQHSRSRCTVSIRDNGEAACGRSIFAEVRGATTKSAGGAATGRTGWREETLAIRRVIGTGTEGTMRVPIDAQAAGKKEGGG